jgi:hypothetical protein
MYTHPLHVTVSGPTTVADFVRRFHPRAAEWADEFVLARERVGAAERGRYYRSLRVGELVAVAPGICLPASSWARLGADERHLMTVRARALVARAPLVFGAHAGAALWRLPMIGPWPARPAVLAERTTGGRSTPYLVRRCEGVPAEIWVVDGLATTSLARTVVDVARYSSFAVAVAMADRALAPKETTEAGALSMSVSRAELLASLVTLDIVSGAAKAAAAIEFADGDSGSAGESLSRVVIHRLGFPRPVLQSVFSDAAGRIIVDFWWPEHSVIGEFDGRGKYLRDEYTGGRSTADVVLAEKQRENRLRARGPTVARWGWEEAMSPPLLRRTLLAAGLPPLA